MPGNNNENFLISINDNREIDYCTFYGGNDSEGAVSMKFMGNQLLFHGSTRSTNNMTTPGAYDGNHNGSYDAFIAFFDFTTTNIAKENQLFDLTIYPNPATHFLNIQSPSPVISIVIHDAVGRTVVAHPSTLAKERVDIQNLPAGVYMLHARTSDGAVSKRFVVE